MGIFIHLAISKSVTCEEWKDVYQETLRLVRAFPLAERREVSIRGVPTLCSVRAEEHEVTYGWHQEKAQIGWFADGDYEYLRTAEQYFLPRDLVTPDQYEEDAPDAMLCSVPSYLGGYTWNDEMFQHCYSLWGNKTQGEPYHMYLLSIACLLASRLGRRAYVYGDITKGQCERAVRMANEHLDQAILVPDQCDKDRLLARIADLSLTELEKLDLYVSLYLGRRDAEFGACIRKHFSRQVCDEYWKSRFQAYQIGVRGFDNALEDYLLWGFEFKEMCSFVRFEDDEGNGHYEEFINRIMDAKLHHPHKDCTDALKIDPDEEEPYGIEMLFAQFALGGAKNKKIDRYIPIEEIRATLHGAVGDVCPVDELIDAYIQEESAQELPELIGDVSDEDRQKAIELDPSYVLTEAMKARRKVLEDIYEEYDIVKSEELPYYEPGDTLAPGVMKAVGRSIAFYRSCLDDRYFELMAQAPEDRCSWLSRQNRSLLLRDKDWEKIYTDIMNRPESFERYYPMVRVRLNNEGLRGMARAFVSNDALYSYALELEQGASKPDA